MKIYIVTHYWNNGEDWEDYRDYEESSYFSTLELAAKEYWDATKDYIGRYTLYSAELDTQNKLVLAESEWKDCPSVSQIAYEEYMEESSQDYGLEDYSYFCDDLHYWRYPACIEEDEDILMEEWLTHEGENYRLLKALEDDRDYDFLLSYLRYKDRG